MDNVEREFGQRDFQISNLEAKIMKREAELQMANDMIAGQRTDLEKLIIAHKTLMMQYQESQIESKELQEFLQAEKYTLAGT